MRRGDTGQTSARIAGDAPVAARYGAGIAGPALPALLFALTTSAEAPSGPWIAPAITVAAAALGAFAQRRR